MLLPNFISILLLLLLPLYSTFLHAQTVSLSTVYTFRGSPDGESPEAGLVAFQGGFIGTTTYGGSTANAGVAFVLSASNSGGWTERIVHRFGATGDGAYPEAAFTPGSAGTFYGTTYGGGSYSFGTVFQLTSHGTGWSEKVLHSFGGSLDGEYPIGNLAVTADQRIFGVTRSGGSFGFGTVFELTPPSSSNLAWTEHIIYDFQGGSDGATPSAGLLLRPGNTLVGVTSGGGAFGAGTVYELNAPLLAGGSWTKATIYGFVGGQSAAQPGTELVSGANGALYGIAQGGGLYQRGCVFQIVPDPTSPGSSVENDLYSFTFGFPQANLGGLMIGKQGQIIGTTTLPVGLHPYGGVFLLAPPTMPGAPWTESTIYAFTGSNDGAYPNPGLVAGKKGTFFGTTQMGTSSNDGSVFELSIE